MYAAGLHEHACCSRVTVLWEKSSTNSSL
uniref:Uncharacterized protein n=1 Tax=Anguilla anguilla TaxID=7936 RepID=A0A0E9XYN0_ANGAN